MRFAKVHSGCGITSSHFFQFKVGVSVMGSHIRTSQGGWDKVCAHVVQLKFHRDSIQEVCGTSRLVTALALTYRWGSMGFDRFIDFLPDAKHLSAVDKSAFADILGESAWSLT